MAEDLATALIAAKPSTVASASKPGYVRISGAQTAEEALTWLLALRGNSSDELSDSAKKWLDDPSVDAIARVAAPASGSAGWRWMRRLHDYHNPEATGDYAEDIYSELVEGRVVIVDLSRGTEQVLQTLSERVVSHVLAEATDRFASGADLHRIQIVIEEAHRLFDRKAYDADSPSPYVRLAKEAAKLKIGLIYATQEVTGVAPAVLANTSNWIVAHLNNSDEIRALSKYYDFQSFEGAILSSEDRGYVRMKTRSGKYIVPVQVAKFDRSMIDRARTESGLPPLPAPKAGA